MINKQELKNFELKNFQLKSGTTIDLDLKYLAFGNLNEDKSNVILYPTRYAGTHLEQGNIINDNFPINPNDYFIIIPNMFCNGVSSSPSNVNGEIKGPNFPLITIYDNVKAQKILLEKTLDIEKIKLVIGWSMGGQQALQWASYFPDSIESAISMCGHAKTTGHTYVFLEGVYAALISDPNWNKGNYESQPNQGKTTMARVWAGWAHGQNWFREKHYLSNGFKNPKEVLDKLWNKIYYQRDANDLLAMIRTWQEHDISNNELYQNDFSKALNSISAKTILMPGHNDLYFPPEDNEIELKDIPNGELRIIPSDYGHYAGAGKSKEDLDFINKAISEILVN